MAQRWFGVARKCHRKSFVIRESPRFSTLGLQATTQVSVFAPGRDEAMSCAISVRMLSRCLRALG